MALQNIRQSLHRKKDTVIEEIVNMTTNKHQLEEGHGVSDAEWILIKGRTIKEFSFDTDTNLERTQNSLFAKNIEKTINKKRTGGFFPI